MNNSIQILVSTLCWHLLTQWPADSIRLRRAPPATVPGFWVGASGGGLGAVLGPSWGQLGPSWARLGGSWASLGPSWGRLGAPWGGARGLLERGWSAIRANPSVYTKTYKNVREINDFWGSRARPGGLPGRSWGLSGASWRPLGVSWGCLGASWERLGAS